MITWKAITKGEVGTTIWTFGASAALKLGSSLVLTRMLYPEAYGAALIIVSILVTLDLLTDFGFHPLIIRHPDAEVPRFLQTAWTLRLVKAIVSSVVLWMAAPFIAEQLNIGMYTREVRLSCFIVLLGGMESFGYLLATRHQDTRCERIIELASTAASSLFAIVWASIDASINALLASMMLSRFILVIGSYTIVRRHRCIKILIDYDHLATILTQSRQIFPSTLVTLIFNQFDKFLVAKLLPLSFAGIYAVGQNAAGLVSSMTSRFGNSVLLPRHASLRRDNAIQIVQHYSAARKPTLLMLILPIAMAGTGAPIVEMLYDNRYSTIGVAITFICIRAFFVNYISCATSLLLAYHHERMHGSPSLIRLITLVLIAWPLHRSYGIYGFLAAIALEPIPALAYVKYFQYKWNLLDTRSEVNILAIIGVAGPVFFILGWSIKNVVINNIL